jgi:hypothetical protein
MMESRHKRSVLMVTGVAAVVLALRMSAMIFAPNTGNVDPHVTLGENKSESNLERQRQEQAMAFVAVTEGEVSRTEERIREATALTVAAGLVASSKFLNGHSPLSVSTLLSDIAEAGLMPPGMQQRGLTDEVESLHGTFVLRYRSDPLAVEVVSLGRVPLDGPALIVRAPRIDVNSASRDGAGLFVATSLERIKVPAPFASDTELLALGFSPELLRAASLPNP